MTETEDIQNNDVIEEKKPVSGLAEKLKEKKKLQKKKKMKRGIIIAAALFFCYAVWWLLKPFKAPETYGMCRTFLELVVPYPQTIYVSEVQTLINGSLELWYTHMDAFGEYRMEPFRCLFKTNAETGYPELVEIKMNKIFLDPEMVKSLNNSIPYFIQNPAIFNYPMPLSDSLADLHFEFDKFIKIRIDIAK